MGCGCWVGIVLPYRVYFKWDWCPTWPGEWLTPILVMSDKTNFPCPWHNVGNRSDLGWVWRGGRAHGLKGGRAFIDIKENILAAVGHTPLIRLRRLGPKEAAVLVKFEASNPGGSIKDRIAVSLIEAAEQDGRLRSGGTVIEATAGNTGVGLAMVAAVKGYRAIFVVPDKMSPEKIAVLNAYGAEVIQTESDVPSHDPRSYQSVARRLAREIPGAAYIGQFEQQANPDAHYASTGPEIWEQTGGMLTHLVGGAGTGGTISGAGRFLKSQKPTIQVIGADPEGSILSGDTPHPYLVEGIGEDYLPNTLDPSVVDRYERVSDAESFAVARALARWEGMLVGGSSGTAVAAALRIAAATPSSLVVAVLPDTGRNYLSGLFQDDWLRRHCPEALIIEQERWPRAQNERRPI